MKRLTLCLALVSMACAPLVGCKKKQKEATPGSSGSAKHAPSPAKPARPAEGAKTETPKASPAKAGAAAAATGCAGLFAKATGSLSMEKAGCIEGTMEKRGHKFDSASCDALENAWPLGSGDFAGLWPKCQQEQGFKDADCDAVLKKCF